MENTESVTIGNSHITLIPTSHVETNSGEFVAQQISEKEPHMVAIELDRSRFEALKQREERGRVDLFEHTTKRELVKEILKLFRYPRKLVVTLVMLVLFLVQKVIQKTKGMKQGESDMEKAVEETANAEALMCLMDREIGETIKRFTSETSFTELLRVIGSTAATPFKILSYKIRRKNADSITNKENVLSQMGTWKENYPTFYRVFITERDELMASRLYWLAQQRIAKQENDEDEEQLTGDDDYEIIAVIGAGHKDGIVSLLEDYKNGEKNPMPVNLTVMTDSHLDVFKTNQ